MTIAALVELHEGRRKKPYVDTVGKWTIGIGRNLTDNGLSEVEIDFLFANDLVAAVQDVARRWPWSADLDEVRRAVLIDMRFNLGGPKLRKFKKFLAALSVHDYDRAAAEMLDSLWARQVKSRARRLSRMMRTGEFPAELRA